MYSVTAIAPPDKIQSAIFKVPEIGQSVPMAEVNI